MPDRNVVREDWSGLKGSGQAAGDAALGPERRRDDRPIIQTLFREKHQASAAPSVRMSLSHHPASGSPSFLPTPASFPDSRCPRLLAAVFLPLSARSALTPPRSSPVLLLSSLLPLHLFKTRSPSYCLPFDRLPGLSDHLTRNDGVPTLLEKLLSLGAEHPPPHALLAAHAKIESKVGTSKQSRKAGPHHICTPRQDAHVGHMPQEISRNEHGRYPASNTPDEGLSV